MLSNFGGGQKRREFLRVGTAGGLSLASLLRMQQATAADPPAKPKRDVNCIFIFTLGGMPQHDMWDFKPHAPPEIRGDFQAIPTNVPGVQLTDLLPKTAQVMDRLAILRGMTHGDSDHGRGYHIMMTGMTPGPGDFNSTKNNNVHPSNTYRVIDALVRANKRFDFILLPGQRHGYTTSGDYVYWRRIDYFAEHL